MKLFYITTKLCYIIEYCRTRHFNLFTVTGTREYVPDFMKYYETKKPETMPDPNNTFTKPPDSHPKNNFDFLKKVCDFTQTWTHL